MSLRQQAVPVKGLGQHDCVEPKSCSKHVLFVGAGKRSDQVLKRNISLHKMKYFSAKIPPPPGQGASCFQSFQYIVLQHVAVMCFLPERKKCAIEPFVETRFFFVGILRFV